MPDPLFRVYTERIHKDKHGSDTGTYDTEGRFLPQKFEDVFAKYADGRDYLTFWDLPDLLKGQRCIADPIGWFGAFFECTLLLPSFFLFSYIRDFFIFRSKYVVIWLLLLTNFEKIYRAGDVVDALA